VLGASQRRRLLVLEKRLDAHCSSPARPLTHPGIMGLCMEQSPVAIALLRKSSKPGIPNLPSSMIADGNIDNFTDVLMSSSFLSFHCNSLSESSSDLVLLE